MCRDMKENNFFLLFLTKQESAALFRGHAKEDTVHFVLPQLFCAFLRKSLVNKRETACFLCSKCNIVIRNHAD